MIQFETVQHGTSQKTKDEIARLVTSSAALYAWRVDTLDRIRFVTMTRQSYQESVFLDHRISQVDDYWIRIPLAVVARLLGQQFADSPEYSDAFQECRRYIFHLGHAGSTLISNVLGCFKDILVLREPALFRWLADYKLNLDERESRISSEQYRGRLRIVIALLSRKLETTDEVLIKATSIANDLAGDILEQMERAKAIFLYTGLESYMATILKGEALEDVLYFAPGRLKRLNRMVGGEGFLLRDMTLGEIVAMSWATEMLTLRDAAEHRADRVAWLDFDKYLDDPSEYLPDLLDHFEIDHSNADLERVLSSDVHATYSKSRKPVSYSAADRKKDIERTLNECGNEIEAGRRWCDTAASLIPQIKSLTNPG